MKVCCVVLGGYVNGLGIINEIFYKTDSDIILFDTKDVMGAKSNKINKFVKVHYDERSIYNTLIELKKNYDKIVLFPTNDIYLEILFNLYDEIKEFCFVPLNPKTFLKAITKDFQYECARELNIPIPKSKVVTNKQELSEVMSELLFPIIIKPTVRDDLKKDVFRNIYLQNKKDYLKFKSKIEFFLARRFTFLVSEFIEGDDETLYSHVGYRGVDGEIKADWIGHKLSQYPRDFGVVSSGISEAPEIVREQSKKLVEKMDIYGLFQTEFKYDKRDKKFKLIEVNLRSMMWNKLGYAMGIYINYALYNDALGNNFLQKNIKQKTVHFIYMKHEILNLFSSKQYWNKFRRNVFVKNKVFAVFEKNDLKPFLFDSVELIKNIFALILRKYLIKTQKKQL